MSRKVSSRIKAAVVCAAMLSTAIATPTLVTNIVTPNTMSAQAAALKTMKADDVYTTYLGDLVKKDAKTISFTITPNYTGNFSYGLGIGITEAPYWQEYDSKKGFTDSKDSSGKEIAINSSQVAVKKGEPVTITFDISKLSLRYEADKWNDTSSEIQFRAYYTGEGSSDSIELTSVKANDTSSPVTPTSPTKPTEPSTDAPSKPAGKDQTVDAGVTIDDNTKSDPQTNVFTGYITDYATSGIKTITLNLESETVLNNFTFGFGINTASEPYWYEYSADGKWVDTSDGKETAISSKRIPTTKEFSVTIDVSSLDLKYVDDEYGRAKFEFRNYYSAGNKVTVKSVTINTSKNTDSGEPEANANGAGYPEVVNKSEVTYDEANNQAVLKNTITRKISGEKLKEALNEGNDVVLTPGYDEEYYLDENGQSTYKSGDPINSVKVDMGNFGVSSNSTAGSFTIDSITAVLSSEDTVTRFMYGGGIGVVEGSIADTEYPKQIAGIDKKQNAGYWYNDCGASELDAFNAMLEIYKQKASPDELVDVITPKQGYDVTDEAALGKYFTVTWEVPDEVKPYERPDDKISFQYWYGEKAVENDEEDATLGKVNVEELYLTYTEETTIPYTGKTETKVNKKVANDDNYEVKYSDLGIKSYQDVYAVILNVSTKADNQMVFDYSTSTDTVDGYYMTSSKYANYCIPKADGTFDMMWIMPTTLVKYQKGVSDYNHVDSDGSFTFYNFYTADHSETPVKSDVTINDITVLYRDGLRLSDSEIELEVGESKQVTATLDDVTYKVANEKIATVSSDGTITGVGKGVTTVTVTAPDGQTATVKVTVKEAATEPTTEPTTTTEAPTEPLAVTLWGDVNVDGKVNISDVVILNKYLVQSASVTEQGLLNSDCWHDEKVDANDSLTILKILVMTYKQSDMPVMPK